MTLLPCWIADQPAFIARTDRNEEGTGGHPGTIIEVVAPVHLRNVLDLSDGDTVAVVVPRDREEGGRHDGGTSPEDRS